jgi:hypothetical protein
MAWCSLKTQGRIYLYIYLTLKNYALVNKYIHPLYCELTFKRSVSYFAQISYYDCPRKRLSREWRKMHNGDLGTANLLLSITIVTKTRRQEAGIAQWYSAGLWAGRSCFESQQVLGIFLFTTASRPALEPTQPPIQWVPGAFSLGLKRPGREDDHSPPSSAEVKNEWSYTGTPPIHLHGVVFSQKEHRDNCIFSFIFRTHGEQNKYMQHWLENAMLGTEA